MAIKNIDNMDTGNGLMPDSIKTLPDHMLGHCKVPVHNVYSVVILVIEWQVPVHYQQLK